LVLVIAAGLVLGIWLLLPLTRVVKSVRHGIAPVTMADLQRRADEWKLRQQAWDQNVDDHRKSNYKLGYRIPYAKAKDLLWWGRLLLQWAESALLQGDEDRVRSELRSLDETAQEWDRRWKGEGIK